MNGQAKKCGISMLFLVLAFFASVIPPRAQAANRVAIVLGNGNYLHTSTLPNPPNDARQVSSALEALEFRVNLLIDASKQDLERLQNDTGKLLRGADVGLFFYAPPKIDTDCVAIASAAAMRPYHPRLPTHA